MKNEMSALDYKTLMRLEREDFLRERKQTEQCNVPATSVPIASAFLPNTLPEENEADGRRWTLSIEGNNHKQSIGFIPSIYYTPSAIDVEMEFKLLETIERTGKKQSAWKQLKARRLQCWGNFPATSTGSIELDLSAPMPSWLEQMIDSLVIEGVFPPDMRPNNVLINQYNAEEGIIHHTDGPAYYEKVVIISLGSECILSFRKKLASEMIGKEFAGDVCSVVLAPRSMLIFENQAYSEYMHGIEMDQSVQVVEEHGPCINLHLISLPTNDQGHHIVSHILHAPMLTVPISVY